ncbi:hypothetical protein SAMN05216317_1303 [Nitrosomonas eutropha]|uniref:Transposase n=1 Tax=Nitrosomonas eutropha TaxID=916 RepID=A0ABX5M8W3_9PROT|nr:hypothetical protein C8R14_1573 [Nitrosomonas eutropha]SCX28795.1 hypothetical protein SAMN05216379_1487 [Nitrosomonas eutropha]SDX08003.1 hypothetical protein SAMN05216317_1303 [Nitrosomonas eutropha]SEJ27865.1 hypothetical protein SAMN05216318_13919 [Nitrosomonas eutropha]
MVKMGGNGGRPRLSEYSARSNMDGEVARVTGRIIAAHLTTEHVWRDLSQP